MRLPSSLIWDACTRSMKGSWKAAYRAGLPHPQTAITTHCKASPDSKRSKPRSEHLLSPGRMIQVNGRTTGFARELMHLLFLLTLASSVPKPIVFHLFWSDSAG